MGKRQRKGKGIFSLKKEEGKKLWDPFRLFSSCVGSRKDPTKFVYLAVRGFCPNRDTVVSKNECKLLTETVQLSCWMRESSWSWLLLNISFNDLKLQFGGT